MGNIANNAQNCYTMIDSGCGKRILEILELLVHKILELLVHKICVKLK